MDEKTCPHKDTGYRLSTDLDGNHSVCAYCATCGSDLPPGTK